MAPNSLPPSFDPREPGERPRLTSAGNVPDGSESADAASAADAEAQPATPGPPPVTSKPARRSVYQPDSTPPPAPATNQGGEALPPSVPPQTTSASRPRAYAPARRPQQPGSVNGSGHAAPHASAPRNVRQPVAARAVPSRGPRTPTALPKVKKPINRRRIISSVLVAVLVLLIGWPTWLIWHTDRSMHRVDVLSGAAGTPGTTYLFAGSDSRDGWNPEDPTEGERSDSVILVNRAPGGQAAMVSMPRDLYVDIPGVGMNKLNASFAYGGPALLVETVEGVTGLTVDHYVQIGMAGVGEIVDALGGVELCWDQDVSDPLSGMEWVAGCHEVDGAESLAFSRMRYEDPLGDVGRTMRQRQLLNAVSSKALSPGVLLNPVEQVRLSSAAADALTVDRKTNVWNVGALLLAMRKAGGAELMGMPPMSSMGEMTAVGSVMLLDEQRAPEFFQALRNGTLTPEDFALQF